LALIRRALLIANPASRRGRWLVKRAQREFARSKVECDVVLTERPGHAAEIARERAAAYDAVFALGGDGTAMEVAGELSGGMHAPGGGAGGTVLVGVLPGGTGNLLARALGISLNVRRAVRQLLDGDVFQIDLGRLDSGRRFAIAAGVGIDAAMIASTPPWFKRRLGVVAYVIMGTYAAVRAVWKRDYIHARVTVDGERFECTAAAVMVANFGAILSGRITLGEGIHADDGVLDVIIFTPASFLDAVRIAVRLMRRDFSPTPMLTYRRGHVIRIETDPPTMMQADGEALGLTPFTATVEPRTAQLLVPRGPAPAGR
jgi:diacylglycerol kinase (ATP)